MKSVIGALVGSVLAVIGGAEAYVAIFPRLQMAFQRMEIDAITANLILGGIPALFLVIAAIALFAGGRPSRLAGAIGLLSTALCVLTYYLSDVLLGAERLGYHATVVTGLVLMYLWAIITGGQKPAVQDAEGAADHVAEPVR
ncbi:hypothetical protein [Zhihengliuella flava]|uniref:Uncharacterized membrane protein YozB (DUF420 family) n=1 Tax=Zhihengliuella flava TaxID=1285193 RepID=A0A931D894_9MICC|nr:hypothetical protein [Zhihengliuella flava]MBG6083833.1 uncharacterized membrane protein YozB (DUF420 family) [Zhihengliuella flava]